MANLPKILRHRDGGGPAEPPERTEPDVQRLEAHGLSWLNIERPAAADTEWLARNHGFHPLDLEDVLSRRRQRAKIDEYDEYLFLVLHFPRFDKGTGRLQATELNVFVARDLVITLPNEPLKPLRALWSRCEAREDARERYMSRGSAFLLYEIVDAMYDYCFPILDKIGFKLDALEDEIFAGHSDALVQNISNVKQEIINFRKIVKPQRPTLGLLERASERYTPQDLEIYFDDIVDKSERIWDSLENYKEVSEALENTNESVIQHRLNDMLKLLTIMSALILPMSLVTSFYGQNFRLPFASETGWSSAILVVCTFVVIGGVLWWYFKKRKWL
jgi:magnesium transporter